MTRLIDHLQGAAAMLNPDYVSKLEDAAVLLSEYEQVIKANIFDECAIGTECKKIYRSIEDARQKPAKD